MSAQGDGSHLPGGSIQAHVNLLTVRNAKLVLALGVAREQLLRRAASADVDQAVAKSIDRLLDYLYSYGSEAGARTTKCERTVGHEGVCRGPEVA